MLNYSPEKLSIYDWLDVFPEAKLYVEKKLKQEIKQWKKELAQNTEIKSKCNSIINKYCKDENRWFWNDYVDIVIIETPNEELQKQIKKNTFLLSGLKPKEVWQEVNGNKITPQDIERAKQVPISTIIEVNRMGFARSPFHEEKVPSFKVYEKQNRWWDFSENSGGDTIDLVCRLRKCEFLEAVKILTGK